MNTAVNSASTASTRLRSSLTETSRQAEAMAAPSSRHRAVCKTPHIEIAISSLARSGDAVHLEFTAGAAKGVTVYAVLADDADRSSVARGENAGRTLEHVAVARSLVRVAKLEPHHSTKRSPSRSRPTPPTGISESSSLPERARTVISWESQHVSYRRKLSRLYKSRMIPGSPL